MPLNPTYGNFNSGDTVTAADVNLRVKDQEEYINGGIEKADFEVSGWVGPQQIVRPEFFGAPAPRVNLTSSDVHMREMRGGVDSGVYTTEAHGERYVPIPGLSATFHVSSQENSTSSTGQAEATIRCCWRTKNRNHGINTTLTGANNESFLDKSDYQVALFALYVNGTYVPGTVRRLYASLNFELLEYSGKNHSIVARANLKRGMNSVSVRVKVLKKTASMGSDPWQKIMVFQRFMNVEVYYL